MWIAEFIFFSLVILILLIFFIYKTIGKKGALKNLFREFKRKLWMTSCLGGIFLGLYLFLLLIGAIFLQEEWKKNALALIRISPLSLVYDGLFLFACVSLLIYFIRMLIKYFFLTRKKDF